MAGSELVQSVQRALDVLETIAAAEEGLRLGEVALRTGFKNTTAHNLIRTLQARGYLVRDANQRFHMGPVIEEISRQRYRYSIFQRAEEAMKRLHERTGKGVVTFSEWTGGEICCRLRLAPEMPGILRRPRDQMFSLFGSASGLCLQAFNPSFRDTVPVKGSFEESAPKHWTSRKDFEHALRQTVRRGLAVVTLDSSYRLAAPVGDRYVLGLSLDLRNEETEPVFDRLKKTARYIAGERGDLSL